MALLQTMCSRQHRCLTCRRHTAQKASFGTSLSFICRSLFVYLHAGLFSEVSFVKKGVLWFFYGHFALVVDLFSRICRSLLVYVFISHFCQVGGTLVWHFSLSPTDTSLSPGAQDTASVMAHIGISHDSHIDESWHTFE